MFNNILKKIYLAIQQKKYFDIACVLTELPGKVCYPLFSPFLY